MRIPESFIQEVVLRNPLEEIVAQYTTLKRAGSNLVCCCPFHNEKTPSFTLYSNPSHYYCYGCGAGGDVITFIRQMENLDYVAAVEYLANRASLPMPVSNPFEKKVDKKRFYEMNAEAARFWHQYLLSDKGKEGLDYLLARGLKMPIIKRFGLGYAPRDWDALVRHLTGKGYRMEEIREGFLGGVSAKTGKPFDYFRGRAIFPIIDVSGNVVAFSGRQVAPMKEGDRKYFNTNDTPVFKKGRVIFGLNVAKNSPEKELILCEGNMDAVSLHAHGVSSAVASLGTALTSEQCRLLSRYARRVLICYDSDRAGRAATLKAIRLLQQTGVRVGVITLSGVTEDGKEVKDPDDFIRAFGKGAFEKRVREAQGAIEYQFSLLRERHTLDSMDGKNAFIRELVELLSGVDSPVERELFISRAAEICGIPAEIIRTQAGKQSVRDARREEKEKLERELRKTQGLGNRVNPDKARFRSSAAKEENILGILLLRSEYLNDRKIRPSLRTELFRCEFCRSVLEALLEESAENAEFSFSSLNARFSPDQIGELEGMKKKREELGNNAPDVLLELILRLSEEQKKEEMRKDPLSADWLSKLRQEKARKDSK